ncbi:MAG: acetyltransferase [Methanoregula sp.]|nr:acetyltransferase [Methanoregula sp.]
MIRVTMQDVPVVLVHGWKSHPGIWNRLVLRLRDEGIPFWNFDQTPLNGASVEEIAAALQAGISKTRREREYFGEIDIICHSMGTCIARYMLEVLDGTTRHERVRQLIGIGPPNKGSALAELFNHPVYGMEIITQLSGVFVPQGYNPAEDLIVQQFRPDSSTMTTLASAGIRSDISYRIICAANLLGTPGFFPIFLGKTWEGSPASGWRQTYAGDGIVPHSDSILPGVALDILPRDPSVLEYNADEYCHIKLPRNPEVIERIIEYLKNH